MVGGVVGDFTSSRLIGQLDGDVRVHRVDDDRVFLWNDGDIEKSSAPLGRRPRSRGPSAVRLGDGMLERRLDGLSVAS